MQIRKSSSPDAGSARLTSKKRSEIDLSTGLERAAAIETSPPPTSQPERRY